MAHEIVLGKVYHKFYKWNVLCSSIEVTVVYTSKNSSSASEIEKKIGELTKSLQTRKQALKDLTHFAPRPANFDEQVIEITQKIIDLRNEINSIKIMLFNLLYHSSK